MDVFPVWLKKQHNRAGLVYKFWQLQSPDAECRCHCSTESTNKPTNLHTQIRHEAESNVDFYSDWQIVTLHVKVDSNFLESAYNVTVVS